MKRRKLSNRFYMEVDEREPWPWWGKALAWLLGTAVWFLLLWSMFAGCES